MQVNSINFKGFDEDYKNFSKDMKDSIGAIRTLRTEIFDDNKDDEFVYADQEPNKKNIWGLLGSVAFVAAVSYGITKKGYEGISKLINSAKKLTQSDNKAVQKILENKAIKGMMAGVDSVKDKAVKTVLNAKDMIVSKMPKQLKSNAVVNFAHDLNLKTSTKVGLAGAAAGTVAASRIDDNENGCADMFENGISVLDSISEKAGKVMEVARILS